MRNIVQKLNIQKYIIFISFQNSLHYQGMAENKYTIYRNNFN